MFFISVVIPIRNEAKHIADVLDRLLEQDYPADRFEILVVDGRSTDSSREIVEEYTRRGENVRLFDNEKRLSGAARNIGVRQARGDVILVVDGHCLIENREMLRNVADAFEKSGADCLGRPQPLEMTGAGVIPWAIATARRSPLGHHPDSFIYSDVAQFSPAISVAVAYRKGVFDHVGLFDETFDACEDVELNDRIDRAGLRCYFDPAIAVRYVPRSTITGLVYQMNRYGRGRIRFWRKQPESFSLKSFGPGFFLMGLLVGLPLCFIHRFFLVIYLSVLGLYGLVVLAESLRLAVTTRRTSLLFLLPIVFPAVHLGFGFGLLREFFLGRKSTVKNSGDRS